MKRTLTSFAVVAGLGLLSLAACEKMKLETAESTTQAPAVVGTELAGLTQPNGKPVNPHLAAMVALSIERANRYNRFYNCYTPAQEKALHERTTSLQQQPQDAQVLEQLVRLEGYTNFQEYQAAETKHEAERALLTKEDPNYFKLSAQEQKAIYGLILDYYHTHKLYPIVQVTHSKGGGSVKVMSSETPTNSDDSPDDPWGEPDPVEGEEGPASCWTAWYACRTSANSEYQYEEDRCFRNGPINYAPCHAYVLYKYRKAEKACKETYNDCISKSKG